MFSILSSFVFALGIWTWCNKPPVVPVEPERVVCPDNYHPVGTEDEGTCEENVKLCQDGLGVEATASQDACELTRPDLPKGEPVVENPTVTPAPPVVAGFQGK